MMIVSRLIYLIILTKSTWSTKLDFSKKMGGEFLYEATFWYES